MRTASEWPGINCLNHFGRRGIARNTVVRSRSPRESRVRDVQGAKRSAVGQTERKRSPEQPGPQGNARRQGRIAHTETHTGLQIPRQRRLAQGVFSPTFPGDFGRSRRNVRECRTFPDFVAFPPNLARESRIRRKLQEPKRHGCRDARGDRGRGGRGVAECKEAHSYRPRHQCPVCS